ncbi:MAG: carbohydrate porin [Gallionella sp.]|jgi:porin|nr:carbohydrate porin [Gallionella sp.]MCK9353477.1 carbohydrate porin [Gallionella sp.]
MGSRLVSLMAVGLVVSNVAFADEAPDWRMETLSGEWGGARSSLYDRGVVVEITHKSDALANASGGVARGGVVLMNSEAAVGVDMSKLVGWDGASAFVQYHVQHGNQSINNYVGSFAGIDNIETGTSTGQFFQAWLQQNSADDSLSLLAGLYAIDSEFYVTDTSGLFLQPPYGMSAEMAQTGRNGPPVFPMGALALRLKYSVSDFYAQGALTDGVPGNLNDAHGTQIRLDKGDGTLAVVEFGYTPAVEEGSYNKISLGLWRYSARADDLVDVDVLGNPVQRIDQGFYVLAERTLFAEQGNAGQGLSGFFRFGTVNKDVYQADWSGSLGLNYQGLFDGRDDDAAGIAVTTSHASAKYRLANAAEASETVVEFTYRAQLQSWLAVQPVVQRIFNPNMDGTIRDAWAVGARLEVAL